MQKIPLFIASDNNYAPYVATTMASILYNTKSFINFYILDSAISFENKEKIRSLNFNNFSVEFINIETEKIFKNFSNNIPHITLSMYSRFLIPELKPEVKKIIYLDCDVILLDDIKLLFDEPLDNYLIGAIPKYIPENNKPNWYKSTDIDFSHKYFNSGVLLMDIEKIKELNFFKDLVLLENKYHNTLNCPDQDILNKYFENNYKILDAKYNVMTNEMHFSGYEYKKPVIRHFNDQYKPWKTKHIKDADKFWEYAKMTPFYEQLNEEFLKNPELKPPELLNNIKKPDKSMLANLRAKMKG